jgi:hypothetical protein
MEACIGLVEDASARLGLLVTNVGFSKAAECRAKSVRGISIDVTEFNRLALWKARVPTISPMLMVAATGAIVSAR